MKSFKDFVIAYNDGTIVQDAAWRAYDIENMVNERQSNEGLRAVYSPRHRGEPMPIRYSSCAAEYGLGSGDRAKLLLGLWQVWAGIASGVRRKGMPLRAAA